MTRGKGVKNPKTLQTSYAYDSLAGESIWSSDGVDALEVHESAPGEPDLSRSGDSAEVNLERRLCCKERERGHDITMRLQLRFLDKLRRGKSR